MEQNLTPADSLLIVALGDPNETLLKTLNTIWQKSKIFVSVVGLQRLQANILEHDKVPRHTVLSADEAIEFRKKYGLTKDSSIPSISRFDPVAVAIGLRPGQICKILRNSPTAINAVYYRLCLA